jgi:two-component system alkaline phosphatase synthesis response regulator PhoP
LLASKPGKVFKRDEILDKVWKWVVVGGERLMYILESREKIGEDL